MQIIEDKSELQLKEVNGTYVDLTLRCAGEIKSRPAWKHNGTTVGQTVDTVLITVVNRTSGRRTVIMTRRNVTERFVGHYQCVDTAFFQSDSDILTIHADAPIKSQPARKRNGTKVSNQGRAQFQLTPNINMFVQTYSPPRRLDKNSSGDEIANVNFFYNIAHVEASAYAH